MRILSAAVLSFFMVSAVFSPVYAKEKAMKNSAAKDIRLTQIDYSKGKTLLQAIKDRQSSREFADKTLDLQILSELLWAAGGISRDDGKRTFPTAMNAQEVEVYAFMKDGIYKYEPKDNKLVLIEAGDKRADTGMQPFVANAAVNLVYVSDLSKMKGDDLNLKTLMCAVDLGHISQNVYLYCASADLACVVRGSVDGAKIAQLLKLDNSKKVFLAQSVGYKK